ncbi:MAG: thrombospondin type 3 repeat-containing protein [Deltaproteobacteria bacterium]|nr:thrombospondin type 3 repeat-containing protein [Deltaproteobacteria bacterium]
MSTGYVDGTQLGSAQSDANPVADVTGILRIGSWAGGGFDVDGLIDELEIYNRALSDEEIQDIVNAGSAGKCRTCTPPPPDMISWWPGDGNANDIRDDNTPTQTLGAPQFLAAKVDQGMQFDGNDGFIVMDNANLNFGTSSFTIDAWVRIDSTSLAADDSVVDKRDLPTSVHKGYLLDVLGPPFVPAGSKQLRMNVYDGSIQVIANANPITDSNFHHVAGVVNRVANTVSIYIDGVLQQTTPLPVGFGSVSNTKRLFIGHQTTDTPTGVQPFNGVIDELEFYDRALSASEIRAIVNAGSAGKCKDADGDGVPDIQNNCPDDPNPDQTNTDGDGQGDACDADIDGDGVLNGNDNCPLNVNPNQADTDSDGVGNVCDDDDDNDSVLDNNDNCPLNANPDQINTDGDGSGDACDADDDNDGVSDSSDNCPLTFPGDADQTDTDGDGNACDEDDDGDGVNDDTDNCPLDHNFDQANNDGDNNGDICDADDDNDSVPDGSDNCPFTANTNQADSDGDGQGNVCDGDADGDDVPNEGDNCPLNPNADQSDLDEDGLGDVCDDDIDGDGVINDNDSCPASNLSPTVVVGSCDSGVVNRFFNDGCTISDLIAECAVGATNHGDFVSCVAHLLNDLKNSGVITGQQKGAILNCAAQADIP